MFEYDIRNTGGGAEEYGITFHLEIVDDVMQWHLSGHIGLTANDNCLPV